MALELFISRRAAREIDRVAGWWATHRPAAPGAVRKDLEAVFALLVEQPGMGGAVTEASSPDVRRFHVDRIRYWVYYRVRGRGWKSSRSGIQVEAAIRRYSANDAEQGGQRTGRKRRLPPAAELRV